MHAAEMAGRRHASRSPGNVRARSEGEAGSDHEHEGLGEEGSRLAGRGRPCRGDRGGAAPCGRTHRPPRAGRPVAARAGQASRRIAAAHRRDRACAATSRSTSSISTSKFSAARWRSSCAWATDESRCSRPQPTLAAASRVLAKAPPADRGARRGLGRSAPSVAASSTVSSFHPGAPPAPNGRAGSLDLRRHHPIAGGSDRRAQAAGQA